MRRGKQRKQQPWQSSSCPAPDAPPSAAGNGHIAKWRRPPGSQNEVQLSSRPNHRFIFCVPQNAPSSICAQPSVTHRIVWPVAEQHRPVAIKRREMAHTGTGCNRSSIP